MICVSAIIVERVLISVAAAARGTNSLPLPDKKNEREDKNFVNLESQLNSIF